MKLEIKEYRGNIEIEGFEEIKSVLSGKTIEEQMEYFSTYENDYREEYSYGSLESARATQYARPLDRDDGIKALLVKDGIIVGINKRGETVLIGETICTYSVIDEDGTGRDEVEEYTTLIFKK